VSIFSKIIVNTTVKGVFKTNSLSLQRELCGAACDPDPFHLVRVVGLTVNPT